MSERTRSQEKDTRDAAQETSMCNHCEHAEKAGVERQKIKDYEAKNRDA